LRPELIRDNCASECPFSSVAPAVTSTAALDATDKDVSIGDAGLAAAALEPSLVEELRMFRNPVVVDGSTPYLPPVTEGFRWTWSRPGRSARA
jgi:dihydrofolate reductase